MGVKGRLQDLVAGLGLIANDDFCACLCLCILVADCVKASHILIFKHLRSDSVCLELSRGQRVLEARI